jgi:hypothetical protein
MRVSTDSYTPSGHGFFEMALLRRFGWSDRSFCP